MKFKRVRKPASPRKIKRNRLAVSGAQRPALSGVEGCQFSFSDGRQCRMPRSAKHSSLCLNHARSLAETEAELDRLLGADEVSQDLVSLSGEFKTASDVNHVLGRLLRLMARNRIPRLNAVACAYICQLLLHSLPSVKSEIWDGLGDSAWDRTVRSALTAQQDASLTTNQ